jgi:branched-subunit amino acid transport protein
MSLWWTFVIAGLLTFAIRLSFIVLLDRISPPEGFRRGLRFVPVAVLSAIILPELAGRQGALDLSPGNPQLWAGAVAALVAWRTRNVLLTLVAGMAALLLLQRLLGS